MPVSSQTAMATSLERLWIHAVLFIQDTEAVTLLLLQVLSGPKMHLIFICFALLAVVLCIG